MNDFPKLHFHAWHKPEKVFTLRAWRASEGLAFAVDSEGQQHVLRFMRLVGAGGDEIWHPPPFPEELLTKIEEIRLVPPPCRANETETERLRKEAAAKKLPKNSDPLLFSKRHSAQAWELARLDYESEVLTPESEDDGPMATLLDEFKLQVQREYEARKKEIEMLTDLHYKGKSVSGVAHYYAHLSLNTGGDHFFLDQERLRLRYSTSDGSKWTLDDAYQWPLLRNPILRARWAKQNNWDFQQNATERKELLDWLGVPSTSLEIQLPKFFSVSSLIGSRPTDYESDKYTDPFSDLGAASGNEMLVAATPRYRVTFANGQRVWLKECLFRKPQNRDERQEFISPTMPILKLQSNEAVRIARELKASAKDLAEIQMKIAASAKDFKETLGKIPEVFADPLAAAARDASIKQGVPEMFVWWVFQEWHLGKFPTIGDTLKRSGLRPKLEQAGLGFSRPTVGRWLKIIREELEERKLMPKRSLNPSSSKARDFNVAQAVDTGQHPGEADEPPEAFVDWVEERDVAKAMPTEDDVLAYLRAHAGDFDLASYGEDDLRKVATRWLRAVIEILNAVPISPLES